MLNRQTGPEPGFVATQRKFSFRFDVPLYLVMNSPDSKNRPKRRRVAGGVSHDDRGNAVWQWAADSGRQLLDSTSTLLKRLEIPGLSIEGEDSAAGKKSGAGQQGRQDFDTKELRLESGPGSDEGYNPYGTTQQREPPKGVHPALRGTRPAPARPPASAPAKRAPQAAVKPAVSGKPAAPGKPGLLARLLGRR